MSIESDVSQILRELQPSRTDGDIFGIEATRVAKGIQQSGLITELAGFRNDVGAGLLAIASVMGVATQDVVARIAESNTYLSRVAEALENPRTTAAHEFRRRGAEALRNGWFNDAAAELTKSLEQDQFSVNSYVLLASALAHLGRSDEVAAALTSATKYVRPDGPGAITGTALTAASMLVDVDRRDDAIRILQAVDTEFASCAEVALKLGVLQGDIAPVEKALRLEPGLAVIALAVAPELANRAIDAVVHGEDGLASKMVRLRDVVGDLRAVSGRFILNIFPDSIDAFEDLATAEQWVIATDFLTAIDSIVADAREEMARDESADRAAVKDELERLRWDFSTTERPVAAAAAQRAEARAEAISRLEAIYSRAPRVVPWV